MILLIKIGLGIKLMTHSSSQPLLQTQPKSEARNPFAKRNSAAAASPTTQVLRSSYQHLFFLI